LSLEAKREIIERNLAIAGCEPPCWGGITPGETSWEEALDLWRGVITKVNGKSDFTYAILGLNERYATYDPDRVEMWSKDETVTGIYIGGQLYDDSIVYTGTLNTYLAGFQLPDVLEQYGPPSQVYGEGYIGAYYDRLWIEYADRGLLFGYAVDTIYDNAAPLICPIAEVSPHIAINFQATGDVFQAYREYLEATQEYYSDWTVIETLSPEAFYTAFREPASPNCLRVVKSVSEDMTPLLPVNFDPVFRPEEDAYLQELLATNGGCELPCWWGITPGVTRLEDARTLFAGYGKPMGVWNWGDETVYEVGLFARHNPAPLDYVIRHKFEVADHIVTALRVVGEPPMPEATGDGPQPYPRHHNGLPVMTTSRHLTQDWQRYTLASTLKLLGTPSQVWIDYTQLDCFGNFYLAIAYDDAGVMAQYGGKVQSKDGKMEICPSAETMTEVSLLLTTPHPEIAWDKQMQGCYPGCMPVTLEEAADIQPDAFYQTYVNPDATACFEVRKDLGVWCP